MAGPPGLSLEPAHPSRAGSKEFPWSGADWRPTPTSTRKALQ